MGQTSHYGFHKWESWQQPGHGAVNAALDEIDAGIQTAADALAAQLPDQVAAGRYTGDGQSIRTISLGFTPRGVLVERSNGQRMPAGSEAVQGGLAVTGGDCTNSSIDVVAIVDGGFQVRMITGRAESNNSSANYRYLAFR